MLIFRSILLWLAFLLVLLQFFWDYNSNILLGVFYRMLPTIILMLWFGLSIVFKVKIKLDAQKTPKFVLVSLKFLRPFASLFIVGGAIFKYLHLPMGNMILTLGLFFLAFYFTVLSIYGKNSIDKPSDILDSQEME